MISEVENLEGKTLEVKGELKAFGGSTVNITPGPDGIAPLSRQNAFKKVEKTEEIESLDLNTPEPASTPAPEAEEMIPISVANPSELEGFKVPEINLPILEDKEPVEDVPQAQNIPMPEMPSEVLAQEPQGINESLFSTNTPTSDPIPSPVETSPAESVPTPSTTEEPTLVNPLLGEVIPPSVPTPEPTSEPTPTEAIGTPTVDFETPTEVGETAVKASVEETPTEVVATPTDEEPVPTPDAVEDPKMENTLTGGTNNNSIFEEELKEDNAKEFNKDEMEKYVVDLINQYNEDLKAKFNELIDNASKEFMSKLVDIPVFLEKKEENVINTPEEAKKTEETIGTVPVQEEPVVPTLNPATPVEESNIPKEVIDELPTLDSALETIPALDAIQPKEEPTPTEPPKEEIVNDGSVFPPASHDNLVEDAFNQINNIQIPSLDTAPIQGKFL